MGGEGDQKTPEELEVEAAAKKAEEDAAAKKAAEDAEKKKQEEADAAKKAALAGVNLSEEQWKVLEQTYKMPREQIVGSWNLIVAAQQSGPAAKLMEKDALREVQMRHADFALLQKEVEVELAKKTPAERQDAAKVEDVFFMVRGRKNAGSSSGGGAAGSGIISGGTHTGDRATSGNGEKWTDEEKAFAAAFGVKDEKEWNTFKNSTEVDLTHERGWKPEFGPKK